jgi:Xaa-Pro aminopeptidase
MGVRFMSHAPTSALSARHRVVRAELHQAALDALVVTALPNVLYLTNFTGTSAIAIVTADRLLLLTDSRYATMVAGIRGTPHECLSLELVLVEGSYDARLADVLAGGGWARVGFEAANLTVSRHAWLTTQLVGASAPPALVPTEGVVERARVVKDDHEVDVLREAARRLSTVARAVPAEIRAGRTERDVAMAIDWRIRDAGFARNAFDTIVASGPNAALPHARPGERKLAEGDLVVLDFGGVYDSYCVDLTRTVVLGKADSRVREVYDAVREAHDAAIHTVTPGRSRFDIDRAARETLDARGFGEAFGHGTGHGLGIEIHEDPRIVRRRADVDARDESVAAGMVFTIEPGAYFPGWGGVRIEDDVLVTGGGVEVLTDAPTELMEIGWT